MTKDELQALNAELISLLANLRDQIDDAMAELDVEGVSDEDCPDDDSK